MACLRRRLDWCTNTTRGECELWACSLTWPKSCCSRVTSTPCVCVCVCGTDACAALRDLIGPSERPGHVTDISMRQLRMRMRRQSVNVTMWSDCWADRKRERGTDGDMYVCRWRARENFPKIAMYTSPTGHSMPFVSILYFALWVCIWRRGMLQLTNVCLYFAPLPVYN